MRQCANAGIPLEVAIVTLHLCSKLLWLLALGAGIELAACQSSTSGSCSMDLGDAGPGAVACNVAPAYVTCSLPSGGGCECLSSDGVSCPDCAGATCQSACAANEFAAACDGPPIVFRDGGSDEDYQSPPSACRSLGVTPAGSGWWCCPCQ